MPNSTIFGHWDPDTYLYFGDPFGNGPPTFLFANQIVVVNQSAFHWDVNIASPSISGWLAFPPQSSRIVQTYGGESSFTFSVPNGVNPPTTYSLAGGRRYAIRCYPPPNACHLEYW